MHVYEHRDLHAAIDIMDFGQLQEWCNSMTHWLNCKLCILDSNYLLRKLCILDSNYLLHKLCILDSNYILHKSLKEIWEVSAGSSTLLLFIKVYKIYIPLMIYSTLDDNYLLYTMHCDDKPTRLCMPLA